MSNVTVCFIRTSNLFDIATFLYYLRVQNCAHLMSELPLSVFNERASRPIWCLVQVTRSNDKNIPMISMKLSTPFGNNNSFWFITLKCAFARQFAIFLALYFNSWVSLYTIRNMFSFEMCSSILKSLSSTLTNEGSRMALSFLYFYNVD